MPIDTPEQGHLPEQQVLFVHVMTPRDAIRPAMESAIHELGAALREQQVSPAGPWFAHHHRRPTETFDFDVCFPVGQPVTLSGRLQHAVLPAIDVVRTIYRGPYEGLPTAWPEFVRWIEANKLGTREDAFEVYATGPRESPDPAQWKTELIYPLRTSNAAQGASA